MKYLPASLFPTSEATDKLATKLRKATECDGIGRPFIFVEVETFLPSWALSTQKAGEQPTSAGRKLEFTKWVAAQQCFGLAAAATGMWAYHAHAAHLDVCLRIAGAYLVHCC